MLIADALDTLLFALVARWDTFARPLFFVLALVCGRLLVVQLAEDVRRWRR